MGRFYKHSSASVSVVEAQPGVCCEYECGVNNTGARSHSESLALARNKGSTRCGVTDVSSSPAKEAFVSNMAHAVIDALLPRSSDLVGLYCGGYLPRRSAFCKFRHVPSAR
jgi:hypothetical protein